MIKIANKRTFFLMILVIILIVSGLAGLYYVKYYKKDKKSYIVDNINSDMSDDSDSLNTKNSSNSGDILSGLIEKGDKISSEIESNKVIAYVNQHYKYEINFPEGWYMDSNSSKKIIEEKEISDGIKLGVGGQTIWSNYSNMGDYSPDDKPDDFRIIVLSIYQDENSESAENFSKKLEFNDNSEKFEFQASGIVGTGFIAPGLTEGDPRVAIIFQKDNLFYVFQLGFMGGDAEVAKKMEGIVGSFKLRD